MKRSARPSKPNAKFFGTDDEGGGGPRKKCENSGCPCVVPVCFARASERCVGNGWTPRWYHVSMGEHFCNECFEYHYRSHKEGYADYAHWKLQWASKGHADTGVRNYFCSEFLPYWVQCQRPECGKWRQLSKDMTITPEFLQSFECGTSRSNLVKKRKLCACSIPEDERVQLVGLSAFVSHCRYIPYLTNCVASQHLTAYYPDGVGLNPIHQSRKTKDKFAPHQKPFVIASTPLHAFAFTPDMMLVSEIEAFRETAQEAPYFYLGLRNLILVLWAVNPKEWLTLERCMSEVMCRGLARVYSIQLLPQILSYLTDIQVINVGLVKPPPQILSQVVNSQESVVVIGAGISGLAAAHTLHSHGYQVTVLEAASTLGGRLGPSWEWSSGHVITGVINNPLALIAHQIDQPIQSVKDSCQLMTNEGRVVDGKIDRRIEFHYNAILDVVSDWRKGRDKVEDISLAEKFKEFHKEFIRESQQYFDDEEEQILQFYLCNLEFTCGCSMDQLSSLYWDHNENLPQFAGDHAKFHKGFGAMLERMADGLDVQFNCKVTAIDHSGDSITIDTEDGGQVKADKVVLSLPLGVLKANCIKFNQDLPADKREAINTMGCGRVEMVALKFSENFWSKSCSSHRMFGRIPINHSQHGTFNIFQGISTQKADPDSCHLLISHIVSDKVEEMQSKTDEEIVTLLMDTLKSLYTSKSIPEPSWSLVTRWSRDPMTQMSYSFLPVGCDGSLYDVMAQDIDGKLFFAGEATNRQFPQTVTGAYISGVREARKIIQWK